MSGDSHDYRPRSPDLSAFSQSQPRPFHPQPQPQPQSHIHSQSTGAYRPPQHRGSYDASPFFTPQGAAQSQSYFPNQLQPPAGPPQPFEQSTYFSSEHQAFPPPQAFPPLQAFPPDQHPYLPFPQHQHHPLGQSPYSQQDPNMPPRRRRGEEMDEYRPAGQAVGPQVGRSGKLDTRPANGGPSQGIEVKTKFPVARIKRIMQADEDVGKVAQATPTAVSKALELFMITLVTKAASEAKEKSSKRVTAQHLKAAVAKDEVLDFLNEIIEKVPNNPEAKGKTRAKSDSPDLMEEGKKKRGPRRKKSETEE